MVVVVMKFCMLYQLVSIISVITIKNIYSFRLILLDQEGIVRVPLSSADKSVNKENFTLYQIFKQIFLPQGYPDSVSHDYINYQIWDTIQAFCSTITG